MSPLKLSKRERREIAGILAYAARKLTEEVDGEHVAMQNVRQVEAYRLVMLGELVFEEGRR